jgi:multidrug efflux pump subunit AcrA (membrane-fusion protein)
MKKTLGFAAAAGLWLGILGGASLAWAYPPAPPARIFGMLRDQLGNPLQGPATVVFTSAAGTNLTTSVTPVVAPDQNYLLQVPLDSGVTSDLYAPTALMPASPFRLLVKMTGPPKLLHVI